MTRAEELEQIADTIYRWLNWGKKPSEDPEGFVVAIPAPTWPRRAMLETWIESLRESAKILEQTDLIEKRAKEIAQAANECCNRSDSYEGNIYKLALRHLREVKGG
jgi:hypothetical protein